MNWLQEFAISAGFLIRLSAFLSYYSILPQKPNGFDYLDADELTFSQVGSSNSPILAEKTSFLKVFYK
jgi:hypothetical protein